MTGSHYIHVCSVDVDVATRETAECVSAPVCFGVHEVHSYSTQCVAFVCSSFKNKDYYLKKSFYL